MQDINLVVGVNCFSHASSLRPVSQICLKGLIKVTVPKGLPLVRIIIVRVMNWNLEFTACGY